MSARIHDDEPDTTEPTVRALLAAQCREWCELPLSYLRTSGTDNAMWRVRVPSDEDVVVRLPRRAGAAAAIEHELEVLGALSETAVARVVRTPTVRHVGEPQEAYPHRWSVLGWIEGSDAWELRDDLDETQDALALDLAQAVRAIREVRGVPAPHRAAGSRGGPVEPLLQRLDRWLADPRWNAPDLLDVAAVQRSAAASLEAAGEEVGVAFVHGDLIPGNLLLERGRLAAIIDWGSAGYADPAQDLAPAWAVLDRGSRPVFREAVEVDDAAWLRARLFELEHAVGGVLYYAPRRHPLADVMSRTLRRILEEG